MSQNRPSQNQVADFQKLLASGDSPEAKALAYALKTQKGGLGSWGPKTKAAFAAACEIADISLESIDFDNPKDPELLKLIGSLRGNTAVHAEDQHGSLEDLVSGVKSQRPFDLTHGLAIHPNELRTTDQLIDAYIKGRAELSERSEEEIRRQLDGDGNGNISKDELIKDFNERAPRRVWHSEQNALVGVLVNDEDIIANPDNPSARHDKIDSLGGVMSQLSKRLGMGYDGREYTSERTGTWLPTGLGDGVLIPATPNFVGGIVSPNQPSQNQVADFQKLLASGDSPEAKALAYALKTQRGGLGSWGPKTKAAFAAACEIADISLESIDFDNPKDPELLKLMGSLRGNTAARAEDPHSSLEDVLNGMENQRLYELTHGLKIHPNGLRTTDQLITDQLIDAYVKGRAELSGRSEEEIRRQLDGDDNWHISRDELIKDFNERAPRRVWHSEQNGRIGVLINDENVVENLDNPFAQDDKISSLDGIMSQLSKRLGMGYDGKEYTIQRTGTWIPTGLGDGVLIPPTPQSDDPRMQPIRGGSLNPDRGNGSLDDSHVVTESKNAKLDALLKEYDFQAKGCFGYKDISEPMYEAVSNIRNSPSTSKTNGIT